MMDAMGWLGALIRLLTTGGEPWRNSRKRGVSSWLWVGQYRYLRNRVRSRIGRNQRNQQSPE